MDNSTDQQTAEKPVGRLARVVDPRDVIIKPVVSEKSYGLIDENNKYTFLVKKTANKTQVKIAVEQIFGVKVTSVNTINRQGKRKDTKRAIVTLKSGSIDIFTAVG
jgi:large subunit ribosomal protein L23